MHHLPKISHGPPHRSLRGDVAPWGIFALVAGQQVGIDVVAAIARGAELDTVAGANARRVCVRISSCRPPTTPTHPDDHNIINTHHTHTMHMGASCIPKSTKANPRAPSGVKGKDVTVAVSSRRGSAQRH